MKCNIVKDTSLCVYLSDYVEWYLLAKFYLFVVYRNDLFRIWFLWFGYIIIIRIHQNRITDYLETIKIFRFNYSFISGSIFKFTF